eukprot:Colp12_sorted_trinity150504_noHs@16701
MAEPRRITSFVQGVDFSAQFRAGQVPALSELSRLKWLDVSKCGLGVVPESVLNLQDLERLNLSKNNIEDVSELPKLPKLHSLLLRKNNIDADNIPAKLFESEDLATLDLSHNKLKLIPPEIKSATNLIALSVSHNQIPVLTQPLCVNAQDL